MPTDRIGNPYIFMQNAKLALSSSKTYITSCMKPIKIQRF